MVCQLEVGDTCYPEFGIGDDICEIGTQCEASTQTCTVTSQGERLFLWIFCEKITIYLGMENGADSSIIEYGEYTDWIY